MNPESLVGQTLGHYSLLRQIGYGGMSTVFLAEDVNLGREVAVKVFWPRPGETRDFLRRFAREARVLAQLDHANILPVFDYGEEEGFAYLVTPYMSGGSLKELLQQRKALPTVDALRLMIPILNALQYAHERGLIHRDIKPGNMLLKGDGSLVLADFGLVKVLSPEGSEHTMLETLSEGGQSITGTPDYMAPEQIQGRAIPASDIYSTGIVLYEMLTGRRPFRGESIMGILMQQMHDEPTPPRQLNPAISAQVEAAVLRALHKNPALRYQQPADLLSALIQATRSNAALLSSSPDWDVPTQQNTLSACYDYPAALPERTRLDVAPASPSSHMMPTRLEPITNPRPPAGNPISMPGVLPAASVMAPASPRRRSPLLAIIISLFIIAALLLGVALTPFGQQLLGFRQGQTPTPNVGGGTPNVVRNGQTPAPGVTQTLPTLSTTCPANGTARAAFMPPMWQGTNANIVYIVNEESANNTPTFGTLKRYDTVTHTKTEIVKMPQTTILSAQLSNDDQWILFSALVNRQPELRLARMDGKELQTLTCAPAGSSIRAPQWTTDQKLAMFGVSPQSGMGGDALYLLTMASGSLQTELVPPSSGLAYTARTWLDNTRVLLAGYVPNSDAPPQNVYILDTKKGANQHPSDLQQVVSINSGTLCWNFDSSFDGAKVFYNQCAPGQALGSSTVNAQPVSGVAPTRVFTSATISITSVRVIDAHNTLLATASNTGMGLVGDTSNDGLYKIATDGSNTATRLVTSPNGSTAVLNSYSQYYWSNVSRDGRQYVVTMITPGQNSLTYTLLYGSLNGGSPNQFASIGGTTQLYIVGWATM